MKPTEIYGLFDPATDELRYIGKANDSAKRLASHLRDSRRRDTPVYRWIRKLADAGAVPVLRVLESTDDWRTSEICLIAEARARGERLLNVADGGDEPACPTEVRAENGRKNAAAIHGDPKRRRIWELKRALGEAVRDGYANNGTRQKMREAAMRCPEIFGEWLNTPDRIE